MIDSDRLSIDKEGEKSILIAKKNYRFLTTLVVKFDLFSKIVTWEYLLPSDYFKVSENLSQFA